jgi:hypothetical protein
MPSATYAWRATAVGTKIYIPSSSYTLCFDTETETITTISAGAPYVGAGVLISTVGEYIYLFGKASAAQTIYKFGYEELVTLSADTLQIVASMNKNKFTLINDSNITVNSGVEKVYKGNSEGKGELVEASLHNGTSWVTI